MFIILLGLNHKSAPVEIREKLAMSKNQIKNNTQNLKDLPGVEGSVILSTCNRTEFYIATKDIDLGKNSLLKFVASYANCPLETLKKHIYIKECRQAVRFGFYDLRGKPNTRPGSGCI